MWRVRFLFSGAAHMLVPALVFVAGFFFVGFCITRAMVSGDPIQIIGVSDSACFVYWAEDDLYLSCDDNPYEVVYTHTDWCAGESR